MKTKTAISLVSHLALATALVTLAGCASGNYQKGAATSSNLSDSATKIGDGRVKINNTLAALDDLVDNPQGDLVPKLKKYNDAVSDLESTAHEVGAKVKDMSASGKEYFQNWDQQVAQIKNEDIKSRSVERKTEVQKQLTDVKKSYVQAKMDFIPFMNDLKDIQTALNTDLTTAGIAAIKSTRDKAKAAAVPLQKSIDTLIAEFRELGVAMASTAPPSQEANQTK
jgi:hypothetical protein